MTSKLSKLLVVVLAFMLAFDTVSAHELNKRQKVIAEEIMDFCTEHWEQYGVLPSTCITQGFMETTLGEAYDNNNLWGISSHGYAGFPTLKHGIKKYCEVVNNGCYGDAPYQLDTKSQIKCILDGGYCEPVGTYYRDACWSIDSYGFTEYDKPLHRKLARQKREDNQKGRFAVKYAPDLKEHYAEVSDKVAIKGAVLVWKANELQGIYDIKPCKDVKVGEIRINNPYLHQKDVRLEVREESKG